MTELLLTLLAYNHSYLTPQYHWKVLPQGMLNNPTMCQYYVNQPWQKLHITFPKVMIIHYMEDMLFAQPDTYFKVLIKATTSIFQAYDFIVALEKIQYTMLFQYLEYKLQQIQLPQRFSIHRTNDFHKLLGDTNWFCPTLGIANHTLSH